MKNRLGKSVKANLVFSQEVKEMAQAMANQTFGGNLSAYISHLILEDLKSKFVQENFTEILSNVRKLQKEMKSAQ